MEKLHFKKNRYGIPIPKNMTTWCAFYVFFVMEILGFLFAYFIIGNIVSGFIFLMNFYLISTLVAALALRGRTV